MDMSYEIYSIYVILIYDIAKKYTALWFKISRKSDYIFPLYYHM